MDPLVPCVFRGLLPLCAPQTQNARGKTALLCFVDLFCARADLVNSHGEVGEVLPAWWGPVCTDRVRVSTGTCSTPAQRVWLLSRPQLMHLMHCVDVL